MTTRTRKTRPPTPHSRTRRLRPNPNAITNTFGVAPGNTALRAYFLDQRQRFKRQGDTMAKMGARLGTTKTTIFRITQGQPASYELAQKIAKEIGADWTTFRVANMPAACPHCGKELTR